jgi:hypothetical protein
MRIDRLTPYRLPPTDPGTLIVEEGPPGHCEVRILTEGAPEVLWKSSLTNTDRIKDGIDYAMQVASHRNIGTIHVVGDPNAKGS